MAHGKKSRQRNRDKQAAKKRAAKQAMKAQYRAWAEAGITKKSRRAGQRQRAERAVVRDHSTVNMAAVAARPCLGKPPGWVNRKLEKLLAA